MSHSTPARMLLPGSAVDSGKRYFLLTVRPEPTADRHGLLLEETREEGLLVDTARVVEVTPAQAARIADVVIGSIKSAGHSASVLRRSNDEPVRLDEATGVRLTLHLAATAPLTRTDRIRSVVAGIDAMSVEESYYWYAKTTGSGGSRALRALRLLLADDHLER